MLRANQEQFNKRLIIVGLDDQSSEKLNLPLTPPRKVIAKAIDNLTELDASVISIDIMFNGKKTEDHYLIESMKKSGRVVIGGNYENRELNRNDLYVTTSFSDETSHLLNKPEWFYSTINKNILKSAKAIGAINNDSSNLTISYSPIIAYHTGKPCMEIIGKDKSRFITKLSIKTIEVLENAIGQFDSDKKHFIIGKYKLELNDSKCLSINYQSTNDKIQRNYYPFYKIVAKDWKTLCKKEDFKNSIVLIIPASTGMLDFVSCPFLADSTTNTMYGGMMHANIINQILEKNYLYQVPSIYVTLSFISFMIIFIFLVYLIPLWIGIILFILISVTYITTSAVLFSDFNVIGLNLILFEILLLLSFCLSLGLKYIRNRQIKSIFSRFVGDNIMKEVLKIRNEKNLLSGKRQELSILLLDIRGFTKLSDEIPSEDVVKILNSFFDVASDVILFNGGTIDKYMGDAIMAFFGAPIGIDDKEKKAVDSLSEIIEFTKSIKFQGHTLKIGGAITTGEVIVGNIGCSKKLEYTIIGPAVNLAARLESLNKKHKTSILFDSKTAEKCGRKDEIISIAKEEIRGFSEKVEIFTLKSKSEE